MLSVRAREGPGMNTPIECLGQLCFQPALQTNTNSKETAQSRIQEGRVLAGRGEGREAANRRRWKGMEGKRAGHWQSTER